MGAEAEGKVCIHVDSYRACLAQSYPYLQLHCLTTGVPMRPPFPSSSSRLKREINSEMGDFVYIQDWKPTHNLRGTIKKTKCLSNLWILFLVIGLLILNL